MKKMYAFFVILTLSGASHARTFVYHKAGNLYQVLESSTKLVETGVTEFKVDDEIVAFKKDGKLFVNANADTSADYVLIAENVGQFEVAHTHVAFKVGATLYYHDGVSKQPPTKIDDGVGAFGIAH